MLDPKRVNIGFYDAIPVDLSQRIALAGGELIKISLPLKMAVAANKTTTSQSGFMDTLRAYSDTEYVVPDLRLALALQPNDADYGQQWGPARVGAEEVWDTSLGSHDVRIAIIDTGTQCTHPDLASNCDPLSPGPLDTGCNHGTKTAGVAAAVTNNDLGIAGVAQSYIYAVHASGAYIQGDLQVCFILTSEAAIHIAALGLMPGRQIISMSFGALDCSPPPANVDACLPLRHAIPLADESPTTIMVASAGNDNGPGGCNTGLIYPASDSHVIAVGGLTESSIGGGTRYSRSNCGLSTSKGLLAPAVNIRTTCMVYEPPDTSVGNPSYCTVPEGTSVAAPFVAGGLALLWSICEDLSKAQLKTILLSTAETLTGLSSSAQGAGVLRVDSMLASAESDYGC